MIKTNSKLLTRFLTQSVAKVPKKSDMKMYVCDEKEKKREKDLCIIIINVTNVECNAITRFRTKGLINPECQL